MGRPALQVRVRIQDTDIDLIAAHFKSKLLTFPQPIQPPRRGRARPVRCLRPVPPCRRSCHRPRHRHGPPGHHPDPQRPDRVRDRHRRPQPARPRRPTAAVDLAPSIPEAQRFSRICRGREELIDHIFVSHALGRGAEHPDLITALCSHRSTYSRGRDTWRAITTARSAGATSVGAAVSYSVAANSFAPRRRCFSDHRGIHRWTVGVGAAM
jgi:hypothetical protein